MEDSKKPIHVKPAFYTFVYEELKRIAQDYGWNLLLHGSMNRDLDLVLIPWRYGADMKYLDTILDKCCEVIGGEIQLQYNEKENEKKRYSVGPHRRRQYIVNINRLNTDTYEDKQYYLDISVVPINGK